jgi:WD40 repeat protein
VLHLWVATADGALISRELNFATALRSMTQPVTGLAVSLDGQQVYAASADGTIRGYQMQTADGNPFYNANHGTPVRDLAISPNGQMLVTAGENATIRLWQAGNGGGIGPQFPNLAGPVQAVAFAPDGQRVIVASGGEQPAVTVFDVTSGQPLERIVGGTAPAVDLVASGPADGSAVRVLSAAGADGLHAAGAYVVRTIPGHSAPLTSLAAIPDAPLQVLSGSLDGTLRRWNLESGQATLQLNHGSAVQSVAVRADGQRYASAGDNGTTRLWNVQNNQPIDLRGDLRLRTLVVRLQQQFNAATARQNAAQQRVTAAEQALTAKTQAEQTAAQALATANTDVTNKQAALKTTEDAKVAAEKAAVEAAAVSQKAARTKSDAETLAMTTAQDAQRAQLKASQLATASQSQPDNQTLATAAATAAQASQTATTAAQAATQAQAAPTQAAQQAAEAANQAAQRAVDTQKPYNDALAALKQAQSVQNLAAQQQAVAARELTAAQTEVPAAKEAFAAAEAALNEVKLQLEQAQQASTAAELPQKTVVFSPDGSTLATAGDYTSVHTWDAETGAPVAAFAGHAGPIRAAAFVGPESLVSVDAQGTAIQWETNPAWMLERTLGSIEDPAILADRVLGLDFSDDGTLLAAGGGVPSRSGQVKVFNTADGSVVLDLPEAHLDSVFAVAISPDGKRLASAGADKYLRTFDLTNGQQLRRFEGHTNYVLGVAWKSDGQLLVSAGADSTMKVWNPDTADQFRTIEGFGKAVTCVRFIGDTEFIIAACGDKLVRQFNANNGGQIIGPFDAQSYLHCVDATPTRQLVVSGGQDGFLRIWDGTNNQMKQTLGPPGVDADAGP